MADSLPLTIAVRLEALRAEINLVNRFTWPELPSHIDVCLAELRTHAPPAAALQAVSDAAAELERALSLYGAIAADHCEIINARNKARGAVEDLENALKQVLA